MQETYYHANDLDRFGDVGKNRPELAEKFFAWYTAVFEDGALSAREKSLIALAVAHAVQCPYCIDAYSTDALEKGAGPGSDDRSRARRVRHPRRGLARPRRADAQPRGPGRDVTARVAFRGGPWGLAESRGDQRRQIGERFGVTKMAGTLPSLASRQLPLASSCEQLATFASSPAGSRVRGGPRRERSAPSPTDRHRDPADQRRQALQPDLRALPCRCGSPTGARS